MMARKSTKAEENARPEGGEAGDETSTAQSRLDEQQTGDDAKAHRDAAAGVQTEPKPPEDGTVIQGPGRVGRPEDKVKVTVAKGQVFSVHHTNDYGVDEGNYEEGQSLEMSRAEARAQRDAGRVDYNDDD